MFRWLVCWLAGVDQGQSIDVTSFFNSLATLRVFSVVMGTRVLVFDVLQNLGEAVTLVVLLVVRCTIMQISSWQYNCGRSCRRIGEIGL